MNELKIYKTEEAMANIKKVLSANMVESFFVPVVMKGVKVDVAFLYSGLPQIEKARPYGKVVIDPKAGTLLEYRNAYVNTIEEFAGFELGEKIRYEVPFAKSAKEQGGLISTVKSLYPDVRGFAFEAELTQEQTNTVKEYYDAFVKATPVALMPYYEAIAPDFMKWLKVIAE